MLSQPRISQSFQRPGMVSRRAMLGRLGVVVLGAAAATGCAPTFVINALYPEAGQLDDTTVARTLRAFVETVLPDAAEPELVARLFAEPALKFADYRRAFVADLRRRSLELNGTEQYEVLAPGERRDVVKAGLDSGAISGRLYNGAVFLTQVVFYGGLWHPQGACPCIGFMGPYVFQGYAALTYPDPDTYLPGCLTSDGNPA